MASADDIATTAVGSDPALDATVPAVREQGGPKAQLGPGEMIGRYEISEILGCGAMGVVYRARDPELGRDLAIKVVPSGSTSEPTRQELLAEARAMAKLRHPAVVPIFDVGATTDGVFIVMPLIKGGTMHDWMRTRHSWRQIISRFIDAGRGLAAAHSAGLVHRDFKPRNLLVDGSNTLVADFGVSSLASSDERAQAAGTPGYMSPEQSAGEVVDAYADQFSFCVCLWEGLYGERPTEANTRDHRDGSALPDAPSGSGRGVPGWVRVALTRGLSPRREARWPTMSALLNHLEYRLTRPRRAAAIVGALALAMAAASLWWFQRKNDLEVCPLPTGRLAGVWDANVRMRVDTVFATVNPSVGPEIRATVMGAIDAYADSWRSMHVEACRLTHVTRAQSADVLDRRMACLERRLSLLRTLTTTLQEARDTTVLKRAEKSVESLPAIEDCGDQDRLMAVVPPPSNPDARARIAEIDTELDAIVALKWRGEHREQLARAEAAVTKARTLDHAPILARALSILTRAQFDNGKDDIATTRELTQVAAAAGMDDVAAIAWLELLARLTTHQSSFEEAQSLEAAAHAAVVRAGSPDWLRFRELYMGAIRATNSGEYPLARERLTQALPLATKPSLRLEVEANLAHIALVMDGPSAALPAARDIVKKYEQQYGTDHALLIDHVMFLAQALHEAGELAEARSTALRTLGLLDRYVAPDSVDRAITLNTLGSIETALGDTSAAIKHLEESEKIFEKAGDLVRHSLTLDSLADAVFARDGLVRARPIHQQALSTLERTMGKEWIYYARVELNYAESLVEGGACGETPPLLEHAAAVLEKEGPPYLGAVHWLKARCHLANRRIDQAISELERAETRCRAGDCGVAADVRWTLGRLLVERQIDRARGTALVGEARSAWIAGGLTQRVGEVDAWRAKH